jgi:ATP-binding cassette subfamily B protein
MLYYTLLFLSLRTMKHSNSLKTYISTLLLKYKIYFSALIIITIIASLFGVLGDYAIKMIIDSVESKSEYNFMLFIGLFILCMLTFNGLYFIGRLFDIKYKPKILAEIVTEMYKKTVNHSLHWFDSHLSGEISSKIINFQESFTTLITALYHATGNLAVISIGLSFVFIINSFVGIVIAIAILVYLTVLSITLQKQLKLQEEYVKSQQETIGIINDSISNIFGIKTIGSIWTELRLKLIPSITNWQNWDRKSRIYDAYYVDLVHAILITLIWGTEILILSYFYKTKIISTGDFAFCVMISWSIYLQLDSLLETILFSINPKIAAIKSSYQFINIPTDVNDAPNAIQLADVKGAIRFEHVEFGYETNSTVFKDFNLEIKPGERVGIVGTSGAGKTTFIKCLLRYFDVRNGSISIDGKNIKQVTQDSLRASISIIPQDITMFHRSILENLQLAKHDATLEEVMDACKKARIHDDISKMSNGYHTIVGERGVKVSGGQRQRIAIARAILKNAPILILDEATSALDTPTEYLIQESINEILDAKNVTTIVIAHRLSTLLHMDRIIVFEHGKIIASGTHKELLAESGKYKTLWESQSGGFIPNNSEII